MIRVRNLKDSQIYIISETKFGPNHDLKLWLNANCFPTGIINYIVQDVVKGQKDWMNIEEPESILYMSIYRGPCPKT